MMTMTESLAEIAYVSAKDELNEYAIYDKLSRLRVAYQPEFGKTLKRLAAMEYKHYEFWKKFCPYREISVSKVKLYLMMLVRVFLGVTFAFKLLERTETSVIEQYKSVAHLVPAEDQSLLQEIIADEQEQRGDALPVGRIGKAAGGGREGGAEAGSRAAWPHR
jgi:hypothetical protein